jgi:hypothetical protein
MYPPRSSRFRATVFRYPLLGKGYDETDVESATLFHPHPRGVKTKKSEFNPRRSEARRATIKSSIYLK